MTPREQASLSAAVFRNTAKDPTWLGYWLARHQQTENFDEPQLAAKLGISEDNLVLLCLCRTPRADHFRDDLVIICDHTGAKLEVLAGILRQEEALHAWKVAAPPAQGWLMAASDRPPEQGEPPAESPEAPHDE